MSLLQNTQVLTPCSTPASINLSQLKAEVKEYMQSRVAFYKSTNKPLYIEDEFSEWWLARATDGKQIGAGSAGMDVKTSKNAHAGSIGPLADGFDAMCVIMNKNGSNEKSLMQNFSTAGKNLDQLFLEKKADEALQLYVTEYAEKLKNTVAKHELGSLYLVAFVSTFNTVHLVSFAIHLDRIPLVSTAGFTKAEKNVLTQGFIAPEHGDVRLYKSKKRLELRLSKGCLEFAELLYEA